MNTETILIIIGAILLIIFVIGLSMFLAQLGEETRREINEENK